MGPYFPSTLMTLLSFKKSENLQLSLKLANTADIIHALSFLRHAAHLGSFLRTSPGLLNGYKQRIKRAQQSASHSTDF
jgi:hypothetical protein